MVESRKIEFPGHSGEALAARLDMPDGEPKAYALFAHCFTCSKDVFAASRIASELSAHAIAVLRFDFTGLGASEGEFANTNFSSNVQDLLHAADYLRDNFEAPALLIGHSLGGAAVLAAAPEIAEAKAVVTIGAPSDAAHVSHNFGAKLDDIAKDGEAEVQLAGRTFKIKKQFLDDIEGQNVLDAVAGMKKALLVCQAPLDETVGIDNATKIFVAAKHPKSFLSLDSANHLLSKKSDAIYAAQCIAAWATRYIGVLETKADASKSASDQPEEGTVEVAEAGTGQFTQTIRVGPHVLTADEPAGVGGDNRGPTPYDYILSGLGACTTMTLRMYANRKDLPLDKVSVVLKHSKIHAEACADCETKEGKIDEISRTITLTGDLSEEQRAKLLEIADKCPVHRTLESEVKIRTKLDD
ncbi:MAG: bifunctional alpha/beta hydrolase/OsmC family protein [Rhodospirillaceae bacterium]